MLFGVCFSWNDPIPDNIQRDLRTWVIELLSFPRRFSSRVEEAISHPHHAFPSLPRLELLAALICLIRKMPRFCISSLLHRLANSSSLGRKQFVSDRVAEIQSHSIPSNVKRSCLEPISTVISGAGKDSGSVLIEARSSASL